MIGLYRRRAWVVVRSTRRLSSEKPSNASPGSSREHEVLVAACLSVEFPDLLGVVLDIQPP